MDLVLHSHPLASYCQKVLVALYENDTPFAAQFVDLGDAAQQEAFRRISPMGKMPALEDRARDRVVTESSIVIEYLAVHHPGPVELVPADRDRALEVRAQDRFFDLYVHDPMQRIVGDRLRPIDHRDPIGVEQARAQLRGAYAVLEDRMRTRTWAAGDFGLADCAAAPALYYANEVEPFVDGYPILAAYFDRLRARPSYARVFAESQPFLQNFPR